MDRTGQHPKNSTPYEHNHCQFCHLEDKSLLHNSDDPVMLQAVTTAYVNAL
jgi:hypothetical protein